MIYIKDEYFYTNWLNDLGTVLKMSKRESKISFLDVIILNL